MIPFLRHLFLEDLWLKLFSLALAILTWTTVNFAVQRSASPGTPLVPVMAEQRLFSGLPVVIMSSAEDVRNLSVNPKEVDVLVRGEAAALDKLRPNDIRVIVDLTGIEAAHDLRKRIEVSTPPGVAYVRVDPEEVQIVFPPRIDAPP